MLPLYRNGHEVVSIMAVRKVLPKPDIEKFNGTSAELAAAIDEYYANTYWFDVTVKSGSAKGKHQNSDWAENARGVYYSDDLRGIDRLNILEDDPCLYDWYHEQVLSERKIFVPSVPKVDWNSGKEAKRRLRADVASQHALQNSLWNKSEFAWDSDARNDIFGEIRNDPTLDMDKHEYSAYQAMTDSKTCLLTGERTLVKRIPDATLGLATASEVPMDDPGNFGALCEDKLWRLLLHPKSGLISDPKWGHTQMVFPWAVYEAKGWSGDCREARRQACAAGERYLTMLDHLARKPGPPRMGMHYQTERSHDFQVFAFTSIGSHWHVLVGCRHNRLPEQHAGAPGMSKTVSLFRKIWSGSIETQWGAWKLLSLIDQIHQWARTTFRDFVIKHLEAWHAYSNENFLLNWDTDDENSKKPQSRKKKRELHDGQDLKLPKWCDYVDPPLRQRTQIRARASLKDMIDQGEERERKLEIIRSVFPSPAEKTSVEERDAAVEDIAIDWSKLPRMLYREKRKRAKKTSLEEHEEIDFSKRRRMLQKEKWKLVDMVIDGVEASSKRKYMSKRQSDISR